MASDDQSPRPMSPFLDFDLIDEPEVSIAGEKKIVEHYYHDDVEAMFMENIKNLRDLSSIDKNKSDKEYKIEGLANLKAAATLAVIWERVKDAARVTESTERTPGGA